MWSSLQIFLYYSGCSENSFWGAFLALTEEVIFLKAIWAKFLVPFWVIKKQERGCISVKDEQTQSRAAAVSALPSGDIQGPGLLNGSRANSLCGLLMDWSRHWTNTANFSI